MQKLYLGIDGGATKTHMALSDDNANVLACIKTGASNIHSDDAKTIEQNYQKGLMQLFSLAKISKSSQLYSVGVGISGLDTKKDQEHIEKIVNAAFTKHLPSKQYVRIVNDSITGFWSGSQNGEGICIIGGTGSNCFGRTKNGKQAWASGMGHILADQGGGYQIGTQALKAAVKSFDGRGSKTKLERMILKHFGVKTMRDIIPKVYYQPFSKTDMAKIALLVEDAAIAGDKVAKQITKDAAYELSLMVQAVGKKLSFKKSQILPIVMIGGVIQKDPVVTKEFKKFVRKIYPKAKFIIPKNPPVVGALSLAFHARKQEFPIDQEFVTCL